MAEANDFSLALELGVSTTTGRSLAEFGSVSYHCSCRGWSDQLFLADAREGEGEGEGVDTRPPRGCARFIEFVLEVRVVLESIGRASF